MNNSADKTSQATIIISAGGTGGHIFPALAVAQLLTSLNYRVVLVGAKHGLENTLVPEHGYLLETVSVGGIRNKGILRKLMLPYTVLRSVSSCLAILRRHKPLAIIGFGGYAAFPIGIAARLFGSPLLIHEQNSVAGLTNRILAKFANRVLTAFPNVLPSRKTQVVGNPVREAILEISLENKLATLNTTDGLRVLVVGGSLGAQVLNDVVPMACAKLGRHIKSVTHQVGRGDAAAVAKSYVGNGIQAEVVKFIADMAGAYAWHDVIICRAGASTVAEVAAAGMCAIFVPYPHAVDDHQTGNALYLVKDNAAYLLPQTNFSIETLVATLSELTPLRCHETGIRARQLAILDSTEQIVQNIRSFL
jgi:UDP-N-acetylglucosamine--N-acetylmuramyl-(pentapeptide) pyrophosphoryl-undecaprenol N-acetylglucosamine transferase